MSAVIPLIDGVLSYLVSLLQSTDLLSLSTVAHGYYTSLATARTRVLTASLFWRSLALLMAEGSASEYKMNMNCSCAGYRASYSSGSLITQRATSNTNSFCISARMQITTKAEGLAVMTTIPLNWKQLPLGVRRTGQPLPEITAECTTNGVLLTVTTKGHLDCTIQYECLVCTAKDGGGVDLSKVPQHSTWENDLVQLVHSQGSYLPSLCLECAHHHWSCPLAYLRGWVINDDILPPTLSWRY